MIPDEIGVVGFALLGLCIGVEVSDCHGVGFKSPQRNVFLFQLAVYGLFVRVSTHGLTSIMVFHGVQKCIP